jgi:hypothetical protein
MLHILGMMMLVAVGLNGARQLLSPSGRADMAWLFQRAGGVLVIFIAGGAILGGIVVAEFTVPCCSNRMMDGRCSAHAT